MATRCKIYRENELFHAGPYLKMLKGDRDNTNALARIETMFKLYEASILSKSAFLRFRGFADNDTPAELEAYVDYSKRSEYFKITATVGEYKLSFDETYSIWVSHIDHLLDWVKTVIPYKAGKELPEGVNAVLELWADTPEGEHFFKEMGELGFDSSGRDKCRYWYSAPFETHNASEKVIPLEYSEDYDHFKLAWQPYSESYQLAVDVEMHGKEPVFFMRDTPILRRMKEYGFKCDEKFIREFSDEADQRQRKLLHEYGLPATEFLEAVKSLFKFNEDRINKISDEHGGLTWRTLNFNATTDKFEFPVYGYDYNCTHLPEKEVERIKARIEKRRAERLVEVEEILLKGKFKNIIAYLKEHGKLSLLSHQYGDEINLWFSMPVTFEIPVKQGESFTKKKLEVTGGIWISGQAKEIWSWREPRETFYPNNLLISLPFCYKTAEGEFPSWDEAVAAGGDIKYGGQFCTGKKASIDLENNSRHDNYAITDDTLARFEKILMNIKADHERYLVDCHYKDAPNG